MKYARVQRVKYVKILEILKQESDEDRPLTTTEIIQKLQARGIVVDRKILYEDIKVLNDTGYEIMCRRTQQNEYYIVDRQFDVPELRILMDAVQAASFIPEKKTDELLQKIASLSGSYRKQLLLRDNVCFDTHKHSNMQIYYSVNEIEEAINRNKKISFQYFDLDHNGKKVYRKEGQKYETNPVAMLFSNDNYYMVAYSEKYDGFTNYRIDRMEAVVMLETDIVDAKQISEFDSNQYRKQSFGMFAGEVEEVTLEFDNSLIDVIFDKFGEKTKILKFANKQTSLTKVNIDSLDGKDISCDTYRTIVKVIPSQQFYGFILGLGGGIKITAPEGVKQKLWDFVRGIEGKYNNNKSYGVGNV